MKGRCKWISPRGPQRVMSCILEEGHGGPHDYRELRPEGLIRAQEALEVLRKRGCDDQFRMYYDGYGSCVAFRGGFAIKDDPIDAIFAAAEAARRFEETS